MKKIICLTTAIILLVLSGCQAPEHHRESHDVNHLYEKDIPVEIVSISCSHWYASVVHYRCELTVKSDEYNLTKSFTLTDSEAAQCKDLKKGDILTANLFSWKNNETQTVNRSDIGYIKF